MKLPLMYFFSASLLVLPLRSRYLFQCPIVTLVLVVYDLISVYIVIKHAVENAIKPRKMNRKLILIFFWYEYFFF